MFIEKETKKHCVKNFSQVNYKSTGGNGYSLSLYDYVEVSSLFFACYHRELIKHGILDGLFTKSREAKLLPILQKLSETVIPASTTDIKVGQQMLLAPIDSRYRRTITVTEGIYMDDCIFDVQVAQKDGYFDDEGSVYIWEIHCMEVNGVWRPFDMTDKEREIKKELKA